VREYYNLEELWGEGRFDRTLNSTAPAPVRRTRRSGGLAAARGRKAA